MRWTLDDFSDAAVRKALIDAMRADGGKIFRALLQRCLKEGDRELYERLIRIPRAALLGSTLAMPHTLLCAVQVRVHAARFALVR